MIPKWPGRAVGVAAVLAPVVVVSAVTGHGLITASVVSTTAVAAHRPEAFLANWWPIVNAYVFASVVSVVAAATPEVVPESSVWLWPSLAAGIVLISFAGRVHAPVAGLPLVVTGATDDLTALHAVGAAVIGAGVTLVSLRFVLRGANRADRWHDVRRSGARWMDTEEHADQ
ncbi:hypothetical protein ACFX43_05490 [Nocardioides sp. YIM B13467]|uniref:hypothetical protein n=1 Tax=Nocardioides sp. YIM B13467 TaxID=3366294 RepID=UPI003671707D